MTVPFRRRVVPVAAGKSPAAGNPGSEQTTTGGFFANSPFTLKGGTPAYFAYLGYLLAIVTLRVPIGTEAMVLAMLTIFMEPRKLTFPKVALWSVALVAWGFVGWGTTEYPDEVWMNMTEFAKVCIVVLVATNVLRTRARLRLVTVVIMLAFIAYPMRGTLINYFVIHETLQGRAIWNMTYANPNDLAGLCLLQFAMVIGILELERTRFVRLTAMVCVAVLPLIVILTQSRGAFIALVAFAGIAAAKNWAAVKGKLPIVAALLLLIIIVAPGSAFDRLGTLQNVESDDPAAMAEDQGSAAQRLAIWDVAIEMFKENPVLGVGLGAYNSAHRVLSRQSQFNPLARGPRDTHSTYLNLLAEQGIVGFTFFVLILYSAVAPSIRARKLARERFPQLANQQLYLEAGLYAYLVAGIWGTYGKLVPTYVYLALVYCSARVLEEEVQQANAAQHAVPQSGGFRRRMAAVAGRG